MDGSPAIRSVIADVSVSMDHHVIAAGRAGRSARAAVGLVIIGTILIAISLATRVAVAASPDPVGAGARVAVEGFAFTPKTVTVEAGHSVVWEVRRDPEQHTVTPADGAAFDGSGQLFDGDDFAVTFDRVGRFDYLCTLHPFMTGTVVVVAVAASATTQAPAPPAMNPSGPAVPAASTPTSGGDTGAAGPALPPGIILAVVATGVALAAAALAVRYRRRIG